MTKIITERLYIKPTHKNCWAIYDQVDHKLIGKIFFRQQWFNIILKPQSLHLGVATEASFGLLKALNQPAYKAKTDLPHAQKFLLNLGFKHQGDYFEATAENLTYPDLYNITNQQLKINTNDILHNKHLTTSQLVDSDMDCFDRPTKLHPQANQAWQAMKSAAANQDVLLQLISAFRSIPYQAKLILNKVENGQNLNDILKVNTAPGHSEHHSGCAIDITTDNYKPLDEQFDQSIAFKWLTNNASKFGFSMSYPKDNNHGVIYEPWHWCYQQK